MQDDYFSYSETCYQHWSCVNKFNKLTSVFHASVLLLIMNFVTCRSSWLLIVFILPFS